MLRSEEPIVGPDGAQDTEALCQRLDAQRYRIADRELELPLDIADCSLLINAFAVDAAAAQSLLGDSGLRAAHVLPGRAVLLLLGVDYRDNPLGDYDEAAVLLSVASETAGQGGWLGGALSALRQKLPYYVWQMPVTQPFTAHAGRFLWGFPKYLADVEVRFEDGRARARFELDGELIFAIEAPAVAAPVQGRQRLSEQAGEVVTLRHGQLQKVLGHTGGSGLRMRPGGKAPQIGESHPMARQLRALGLPKRPLASASLSLAHMRFDVAEPFAP
ncbi:MAG: acetoacetate decarboxylase family protein [Myxococcales bacterium]|nr:acetoacetate decarboxylase family protein [Myxococcales bacterium]